jgi:hypothetical protein
MEGAHGDPFSGARLAQVLIWQFPPDTLPD